MITKISFLECFPSTKNVCSEYKWYNGKKGAMLLESCYDEQGVEDWFYGFANMEGENRERNFRIWKERNGNMTGRPTVVGIAAYWIAFHKGKSIDDLFDEYVRPKKEAYYKRHRSEGKSYGKDLKQEFYDNYILPKEELYNKLSEAIFEYITPEDTQRLKDVMNAFTDYLLQKSTLKKNQKQAPTLQGYLEKINNDPLMIENIGYVVAGAKFELNLMEAIIRGIREEWLMDKAIQLITDTWYEFLNREEESCYNTICNIPEYQLGIGGVYTKEHNLKMPKNLTIERDLESIKEDELKRRKIQEKYERKRAETNEQKLENDEISDSEEFKKNEDVEEYDENKKEKKITDEVTHTKQQKIIPYDTSLDQIFDERVKVEQVKKALDNLTFKKNGRVDWFVVYNVFLHLKWLKENCKQNAFLKWVNLQFKCGWVKDEHFTFSRDVHKELRDNDISCWKTIDNNQYTKGTKYYNFAVLLRNTFEIVIIEGKESKEPVKNFTIGMNRDRPVFMAKPGQYINWGK